MPETRYNVEIKFDGEKKFTYVNQQYTLHYAKIMANKPYYRNHGQIRIRKVVKTIVWKSKVGTKDD